MKQRFQDLMLLLKKDRKYQFIILVAVITMAWALLHKPSSPMPPKPLRVKPAPKTGAPSAEEGFNDLITAFKTDVVTLKTQVSEMKNAREGDKKDAEEASARMAEILKTVLTRMEEKNSADRAMAVAQSQNSGSPVSAESVEDPGDPNSGMATYNNGADGGTIEAFKAKPDFAPAPPPAPAQQRTAIVGTGDHVRVKLIGAVHASTDGTPYPVLFKIVSDVRGPNDSNLPVGEAILVAAAQGSLTDSRALFRLTSLNMAYPDGRRNVLDIDGWVVGEDGIAGMEGKLIDPIGKAIAAAGMGGMLAGIGEGLSAKNMSVQSNAYGGQTISLTGSEQEYAAGQGLSSAAKAWSRIVEQRVQKLQPMVEVLSGREGTAIFSRSFKIPGLIEAYQLNEDSYSSVD